MFTLPNVVEEAALGGTRRRVVELALRPVQDICGDVPKPRKWVENGRALHKIDSPEESQHDDLIDHKTRKDLEREKGERESKKKGSQK